MEITLNDEGQIILTPVFTLTKYEIEELRMVLNDVAEGKVSEVYTINEMIEKFALK